MSDENKKLPDSIKLDGEGNLLDVVVNSGTPQEKTIQMSAESLVEQSKVKKGVWSKGEKRLLHLFAVLGLINFFAYFLTQSSYVIQNIYWVYGFLTLADVIAFFAGLAIVDSRVHKKSSLPGRVKTFIAITGLWLISVPVVVIQYYYPVISINLVDVANLLWGTSLVASGIYEASYFGVILMCWLTKGMELQ